MIILYTSLIFSCVWLGVEMAKKLQAKEKFYSDMLGFLMEYEHNLSFVQKEYSAVVEEYANHENVGEPFKKFIINPRESGAHREFLSAHEERELLTIFCSLGKSDEYTETKIVEGQKLLVKARLDESKKRAEKYSSLSIKLSFFVGVLLVLLLL